MSKSAVGLFPGQGSQFVGMGSKLAAAEPLAAEVFDRTSDATGIDVRRLCWKADNEVLQRTENAQLALTVVSIAAHAVFESKVGDTIDAFSGHSVGAIAAAAAAQYLSPESAAVLAQERGRLMAAAPGSGGMLAVAVPLFQSPDERVDFGLELALRFDLDVAAFNGPRQLVLAGSSPSLEAAASGLGAKAKKLNVSHAFHSRLMEPVGREWEAILTATKLEETGRTYVGCTDGQPTSAGDGVRDDLRRGLRSPVMWTSVMETTRHFERVFIFGCGGAIARLARPYLQDREVHSVDERVPLLARPYKVKKEDPMNEHHKDRPTALVTGSSRGIGRACATHMAKAGYDVVGFSRREEAEGSETAQLVAAAGGEYTSYEVDVSNEADVRAAFRSFLTSNSRRLDAVIVSAGITADGLTATMSADRFDSVIAVNLRGTFLICRESVKAMRKTGGAIVLLSSTSGLSGQAGQVNYSASKGGVNAMTQALAKEVAPLGIRVNAVAPGFTDTDMFRRMDPKARSSLTQHIPLQRVAEPDEVARAVRFLATEESSYITGHILSVDGGLTA
ncbi:SDR family oxidoreductase [Arthrobacter sp. NA-172]|uniref:SDR family oxidoreductase n=1 Tax=Arthrobacter sp. NA-172 TaxID=3367524 RepID=UPI0037546665